MNIKPNDLPEHIRKLNPHLFVGRVEIAEPKRDQPQALDRNRPSRKGCAKGMVISLVSLRRRKLDDDNLAGGFKPLRDAIAQTLRIDDGDPSVRWEYGQVETRGEEGTVVKIQGRVDVSPISEA